MRSSRRKEGLKVVLGLSIFVAEVALFGILYHTFWPLSHLGARRANLLCSNLSLFSPEAISDSLGASL